MTTYLLADSEAKVVYRALLQRKRYLEMARAEGKEVSRELSTVINLLKDWLI